MTETLCSSGAVKYKAGANASSTITNDPVAMTQFINQAEGLICTEAKTDFVAGYASYSANYKQIIEMAASALAAVMVANYDPTGYVLREYENIVNVNWAQYKEVMRLLKEQDYKDFVI